MRMAKKPLNLLIDEELIAKARGHGLVISKFLENKLQEYFSFIDAVSRAPDNRYAEGEIRTPAPRVENRLSRPAR